MKGEEEGKKKRREEKKRIPWMRRGRNWEGEGEREKKKTVLFLIKKNRNGFFHREEECVSAKNTDSNSMAGYDGFYRRT